MTREGAREKGAFQNIYSSSPPGLKKDGTADFFSLHTLLEDNFTASNYPVMYPQAHTSTHKQMADADGALECSICHDVLGSGTVQTPCGHAYCADCLAAWLKEAPRCPLCNAHVSSRDLRKLAAIEGGLRLRGGEEEIEACAEIDALRERRRRDESALERLRAEIHRVRAPPQPQLPPPLAAAPAAEPPRPPLTALRSQPQSSTTSPIECVAEQRPPLSPERCGPVAVAAAAAEYSELMSPDEAWLAAVARLVP